MRIKGFDKNLCCRDMQFEIGKEYKIELDGRKMELCSDTVFHYCDSLQRVHEYYRADNASNRFCEIEVLGEEVTDGQKCGSNHIRIIREIVGEELKQLKGLINGNTGVFNSGDWNSGDWNSGNRNSGDRNSGNRNSGDWNSGDWNSGNWNSGDRNSGSRNSGDWNSGGRNSGNWNSGDWNSGVFNSCSFSNGVFCNKEDTNIRIFNTPSSMSSEEFYRSEYWDAMYSVAFPLTEWVDYTEEEKQADEKKALTGGYLKKNTYKEACAKWWDAMTEENKEIIKSMPNFNKEIFKDITGIEV